MKDNSVPLPISSNDQASYAITPIPAFHTMVIGDLTTKPTHAIELLSYNAIELLIYNEWNEALELLRQHQTNRAKV
jgi:hypothetical protein